MPTWEWWPACRGSGLRVRAGQPAGGTATADLDLQDSPPLVGTGTSPQRGDPASPDRCASYVR